METQPILQVVYAVVGMLFFIGIWWSVQALSLRFQATQSKFLPDNEHPVISSTCSGCSMHSVGCTAGSSGPRDTAAEKNEESSGNISG